jgi:hypothetical protein
MMCQSQNYILVNAKKWIFKTGMRVSLYRGQEEKIYESCKVAKSSLWHIFFPKQFNEERLSLHFMNVDFDAHVDCVLKNLKNAKIS